jgi:ABC-type antimicrobial peptide transport system permease subunit
MSTFFPYSDSSGSQLVILCAVVRTHGDPRTLTPRIREELRAIDPALPVLRIDTVDEQLSDVLAQDRLLALLAAFFGGMGVLLSCLGLYGLVAHMTSRRTPEIAVRVALGATRRDLLWMVLGDGLRTVLIGVGVGIPVAVVAGRLIAPQLFEVRAGDPVILGLAAMTMAAVAAAATLIPARRAAGIDPIAALRDS